ncbi:hypothetical protein GCM10028805_04540 [Spirosoma harenae]
MNVLVIGDEHTYGYGLSAGKLSYIGHFIRQISQTGQNVSVEAYAHLTIPQIVTALSHLPLNRYDLIMLQLDHSLLYPARSASMETCMAAPILPYSHKEFKQTRGLDQLKSVGNAILSFVRPNRSLIVTSLLKILRPYRHNVLLMTPFPHRERLNQWLRHRSRAILLDEADEQLFSVFDTDSVIEKGEEYFLTNDKEHLNAISHELLGRFLFDFYLSAPTIVTIQTIRREQ